MRFEVTILGSSSAIPTKDRFPTAQLVNFYDKYYLLDCGEGTQIQLRRYKFSMQRIHSIFISHCHADHFLGLPGLLSTMDLLGRQTELHIYAPEPVIEFIRSYFRLTESEVSFFIHFHSINPALSETLIDTDQLTVKTLPLRHSVPCVGFLFREKPRKRNMRKDALKNYFLTVEEILRIKEGEDYITPQGELVPNDKLTTQPKPARSYAFVTDTVYHAPIIPEIKNVDVLYHEATFADNMKRRARQTFHSTATDAARMARDANARQLVIGHYSVRYENPDVLLQEALQTFPDTQLSWEGKTIQIQSRNL